MILFFSASSFAPSSGRKSNGLTILKRKPLISIIIPTCNHLENALNKLVYQSELYDIEYRIKHKDDSWRWVNDRAINIKSGENGKIFIGMLVDITENKKN